MIAQPTPLQALTLNPGDKVLKAFAHQPRWRSRKPWSAGVPQVIYPKRI